jgi:transposase
VEEHYKSQVLDHLGLVAAMVNELGIVEVIDQHVKQDREQKIVSVGQAVKAMILNGLGFANQRLYLVSHFFENKPTELLIGQGIRPEHLNDDTLGRSLDALFETGVTWLFSLISAEAMKRLGLSGSRYKNMDITSFHMDGVYNSQDDDIEDGVVHITPGYSRDHRPDLNQVALNLISENKAGLPCYIEVLDGNSSDKSVFSRLVEKHVSGLQPLSKNDILVADSAFYTKETLEIMGSTPWVSRVPETISEAKEAIRQVNSNDMTEIDKEYRYNAIKSQYAGIDQRWLVIESDPAKKRATKTLNKNMSKGTEQELKEWEKMTKQEFACQQDAEKALTRFVKGLKFTTIEAHEVIEVPRYKGRGRPSLDQKPCHFEYYLCGNVATDLAKRNNRLSYEGRFIVATNILDTCVIPDEALLTAYKGQSMVERGFRFLKEPMFHASSFFLKSVKRIMALLMIMTLSLMVYAALEYRSRECLKKQGETFPDQKGKGTERPTARWIFCYFSGIHILIMDNVRNIVLNLNEYHRKLLNLLGPPYEAIYSQNSC